MPLSKVAITYSPAFPKKTITSGVIRFNFELYDFNFLKNM